jgi:hypothetical protein
LAFSAGGGSGSGQLDGSISLRAGGGEIGRVLINAQIAALQLLHTPYTSKKDTLQTV